MLVDGRSLPDRTRIEADVCVVGGGPAGLTLARRLAGSRIRVALLESGGDGVDPDVAELAAGKYTGISIEPLEATRVRALGGTSAIWTGYCRTLDDSDFAPRPWIPFSGWPFGREELVSYYAKAHRALDVRSPEYEVEKWSARTGYPYLRTAPRAIGHRMSLCRPRNFWDAHASELQKAGDVAVYTYATVLGIRLTEDGRAVDRLDVGTLDGKRFTATARRYVLACGGLENARLLLLSNDVQKPGVGNDHDLVGRYFMEHPRFVAGTLLLAGRGMPKRGLYSELYLGDGFSVRSDLATPASVQEREGIANALVRLDPSDKEELTGGAHAARRMLRQVRQGRIPRDLGQNLWTVISDLDGVLAAMYRRYVRDQDRSWNSFAIESYIEQVPNPDSRLVLGDERDRLGQPQAHLIWKLSDLDRRSAYRVVELLAQEAGSADIGRVRIEIGFDDVFPPSTGWGHHHMGTTRMHDDPHRGVVDRHARVHGISNLFIAGASLFPSAGSAPPTLTVVALAERLADHLRAGLDS